MTETTIDDKVKIECTYWIMAPRWDVPERVRVEGFDKLHCQVAYLGPFSPLPAVCHEESFELMRQRAEEFRNPPPKAPEPDGLDGLRRIEAERFRRIAQLERERDQHIKDLNRLRRELSPTGRLEDYIP